MNKPDTLQDMIENTIKINNYFYERSLEKKRSYSFGKKQKNRKKK
jgi:hypothetical protein